MTEYSFSKSTYLSNFFGERIYSTDVDVTTHYIVDYQRNEQYNTITKNEFSNLNIANKCNCMNV